ncbi:LysM peptidoglycan-binding domain-containing protein [Campylobacter concisus]|jgi:iron-regulated protein frpC
MSYNKINLDTIEIVCKIDSDNCTADNESNKSNGANKQGNTSDFLNYLGAIATGVDEVVKNSGDGRGAAIATGIVASRLGKLSDATSVLQSVSSDEPSYEIPKALIKIWAGAKSAVYLSKKAIEITKNIPNPYVRGAFVIASGILGAYYGPNAVELFMDQSKDILNKFSQNIANTADEARQRHEAVKELNKCLFDFEKKNSLTPVSDDKFGREMLVDLLKHVNSGDKTFTLKFDLSDKQSEAINKVSISEKLTDFIESSKELNLNIDQITLNSQTYDVKKLPNDQIVRAIEDIPEVSFLLSNILIKPGEKLNLGDKGEYVVKKGDTLSQIAEKYGFKTKELVLLNRYLVNEGRIKFSQDSILIQTDKTQEWDKKYSPEALAALQEVKEKFNILAAFLPQTLQDAQNFYSQFLGFTSISLYDPLILDLNGNGKIDLTSTSNGVHFDHNGDKISHKSSWISKEDGILAYDRNGNGNIDDGSELFGNFTHIKDKEGNQRLAKDGYEALKEFDSNSDGLIDNKDDKFKDLKIWQDANFNGISDEGELKSLDELGIASLSLNHNEVNEDLGGGNTLSLKGSYTKTDGTAHSMGDLNFNVDTISCRR